MRIEFGLHRSITLKPEEFIKAAVKIGEFEYQRPDGKVTLITLPKEWTDSLVIDKDVKIINNDGKKCTWETQIKEEGYAKNEKKTHEDMQKITEQVNASLSDFKKTMSGFESSIAKTNSEIQTLQSQLPEPKKERMFYIPPGIKAEPNKVEFLPGTRIRIDSNLFPKKPNDAEKENKPAEKERDIDHMILELQKRQMADRYKKSDSVS